jgi:hypothetical protein
MAIFTTFLLIWGIDAIKPIRDAPRVVGDRANEDSTDREDEDRRRPVAGGRCPGPEVYPGPARSTDHQAMKITPRLKAMGEELGSPDAGV